MEPRPAGHLVTRDDYALLSDVSTLWSAECRDIPVTRRDVPIGSSQPRYGQRDQGTLQDTSGTAIRPTPCEFTSPVPTIFIGELASTKPSPITT